MSWVNVLCGRMLRVHGLCSRLWDNLIRRLFGVNGLYGHVKSNDLRSAAMFAGFLVAFQLVGALVLFPLLIARDLDHAWFIDFPAYAQRYVPLVLAAGGALFAGQFLFHIRSVRSAVKFNYVERRTDPRLVNIVETQAIAAGLPFPKVGVIESRALNAFVCGLGARSAVVVVTRGLLDTLDDNELVAVVAHEVTHIVNGDIRLMAAANVLMDNLRLLQTQNPLRILNWRQILLCVVIPPFLLLFLASGFVTFVSFTLARVSRLLISISREFIADAEAVRLTHNPAALITALRIIEARGGTVEGIHPGTDAMMIHGAVAGPYASHPTIAERIAILARLTGDMAYASASRKDTRVDARPMDPVMAIRQAAVGRQTAAGSESTSLNLRTLIARANAGAIECVLGLTARQALLIVAGIAGLLAMTANGNLNGRLAFFNPRFLLGLKQISSGTFAVNGTTGDRSVSFARDAASTSGQEQRRADALSTVMGGQWNAAAGTAGIVAYSQPNSVVPPGAQPPATTNPVEARCFATEPKYQVGDRGLYPVHQPDARLVQILSTGPDADGIVLERYLAHRVKSLRFVANAKSENLDVVLLSYVRTRKITLEIMHRFFGVPGLQIMREAYDSAEDRAVLEMLRRRLSERAPALVDDKRIAAEIALLVTAPENFIPCPARAL